MRVSQVFIHLFLCRSECGAQLSYMRMKYLIHLFGAKPVQKQTILGYIHYSVIVLIVSLNAGLGHDRGHGEHLGRELARSAPALGWRSTKAQWPH